ncbi:RHS repeat protein, partial [Arachnia propionica]
DPAGNITQVTHPGLATATLERDQKGRLTRAVLDDAIHQWGYTNGFITHHTTTSQGLAHTAAMDYTDAGWLASVTIDGQHTRYHYDDAGQLLQATTPHGVNSWSYDPAGRLTTETIDGTTWERTYNLAGQLLQATNGAETITYTHDHTGRRTTETHSDGDRRDYTWTALSQLATITTHHNDQVHHTTTVVDALGHLAHINNHDIFTDPTTGTLLQADNHTIITAGPLTATTNHGWLPSSWRPHRHTTPTNP